MVEQAVAHSPPAVPKDPFATVQGMDFEQIQAYFWDMKDLQDMGKGKAQWIFRVFTRQQTIILHQ